jgi:hypothetical protein
MSSADSGIIVTFGYENSKNQSEEIIFHVPGNLTWSAIGLAYLYEQTRASFLCKPGTEGFDDEAWSSWHLMSVTEPEYKDAFFLVDGISSNPELLIDHDRNEK